MLAASTLRHEKQALAALNGIVQIRMRPNGFFLIVHETNVKFLNPKGGFGLDMYLYEKDPKKHEFENEFNF